MENVASIPAQSVKKSIQPMEAFVVGRVESSRVHNKVRYTVILVPAPDPYSRPQVVQVRSKTLLGQRDEEVRVLCRLGGFKRRPFKSTDSETGEVSLVTPVEITLDAVEA